LIENGMKGDSPTSIIWQAKRNPQKGLFLS